MKPLPFALIYATPLLLLAGWWAGGAWTLAVPAFVFVALPLADGLVGDDPTEPTGAEAGDWRFDAILRAWAPLQLGLLAAAIAWVGAGHGTALERLGLAVSLGVLGGAGGITVAHELMHRKAPLDRALAEVLMSAVLYTWFCVEHVLGHHRTVATPADPAFAPQGQGVYRYLPQTLLGAPRSAWRLETERVRRRGLRGLADRRARYPLDLALAIGLAAAIGGWAGLALLGAQALVAVLLLEVVNYVEHYGLARAELAPGRYERVGPAHSWNTPKRLTNWYLFNLQRHADHHANAARPYHALRNLAEGPVLPAGYATMVLVALVPPLWFRLMDPRVDAERARRAGALAARVTTA